MWHFGFCLWLRRGWGCALQTHITNLQSSQLTEAFSESPILLTVSYVLHYQSSVAKIWNKLEFCYRLLNGFDRCHNPNDFVTLSLHINGIYQTL